MSYSIIGSGAIGTALARQFARKGVPVRIANSRSPEALSDLARDLGPSIQPSTLEQALAADILILAVPFRAVPEVVGRIADWQGRIVVDATNAIDFPAFTPSNLAGRLSSEVIADLVPGARLVKAFNTLPAALLAEAPDGNGGRRVIFLSGDDNAANAEVAGLVARLGYAPISLGAISTGGRLQQFAGPLMVHDLIKRD